MITHYEKKGSSRESLQDVYMELKLPACDIYALCDGVTGKNHCREGIFAVITAIADQINHLEENAFTEDILKKVISRGITRAIEQTADDLKVDRHELASTLIMLICPVYDRSVYYTVHLGDGCIFRINEGRVDGISYPVHGVFVNQTFTTTSPKVYDNIRVYKHSAQQGERLVAMTDGLYNFLNEFNVFDILLQDDFIGSLKHISIEDDISVLIKD